MSSFHDLHVWREAMMLVEEAYAASKAFPEEERYGVRSQLRRASVSIPANIAEGCQQLHRRAFVHYLRIALGSQAEVTVYLELASRLMMIQEPTYLRLRERCDRVGRMLNGLIASLSPPTTN